MGQCSCCCHGLLLVRESHSVHRRRHPVRGCQACSIICALLHPLHRCCAFSHALSLWMWSGWSALVSWLMHTTFASRRTGIAELVRLAGSLQRQALQGLHLAADAADPVTRQANVFRRSRGQDATSRRCSFVFTSPLSSVRFTGPLAKSGAATRLARPRGRTTP